MTFIVVQLLIGINIKIKMSVRCLIMDVDGTLTDGRIYMGTGGELMKSFSVKDGHGIRLIHSKYDVTPVIITGRESAIVQNRCEELKINDLYQGVKDKVSIVSDYVKRIAPGIVSYVGDDTNDLAAIQYVNEHGGITACPADAVDAIKCEVTFICAHNGGDGAVREFIDYLISNNLV